MIEFKTPILKGILKNHLELKPKILNLIEKTNDSFLFKKDELLNDNIHKLDWDKSTDFNREWVTLLQPYLKDTLENMILKIGLTEVIFKNIWYQQYGYGGTHGWHTHGNNFTGVYYLSFDKEKHPTTEILNPNNPKDKISIEAEEGQIIAFPSYFIHRGVINLQNTNKTIISFNIDIQSPVFEYIK
tara:strand:- start:181 stop:738 length:558 start_codon:yes stop_codon:yes gene_type:complete